METKTLEVSGHVVSETVDSGSKSEREDVVLKTDGGDSYVLRRREGPSFGDHSLDELVGSSITTNGVAFGRTLIMHDWRARE